MELQDFTENALKTESRIDAVCVRQDVLEAALIAFISSARILDALKKNIFYGKPFNDNNLINSAMNLEDSSSTLSGSLISEYNVAIDSAPKDTLQVDPRIFHSIIGICTEAGELGELIFNSIRRNDDFDTVNFGEELGDLAWYQAIGADASNLNLDNILETVIKKLSLRYPDKFTSDDAINRNTDDERSLLEDNLKE